MSEKTDYGKYIVVTDRKLCSIPFTEQIKRVAGLHPKALILREKDLEDEAYLELAGSVKDICDEAGVDFFVHSRLEIAHKLDCKSIHVPMQGLCENPGITRQVENISVSCHSVKEAVLAQVLGATRIILGTIYETECKPGLKGSGPELVREVTSSVDIPVYAIGGIKPDNIDEVISAGAAGGCMMSFFMKL